MRATRNNLPRRQIQFNQVHHQLRATQFILHPKHHSAECSSSSFKQLDILSAK